MLRRLPAKVAAAAGLAALVAACSSGGGSTGSGQPSAGTVKVGVICSCSGASGSAYQAGERAFEAWAKTVNASGGIDGRTVDVINKDDANNPGSGVTAAQALISADAAVVVDLSNTDQAWAPKVVAANIPIIPSAQSSLHGPDYYPVGQTHASYIPSEIGVAKAAGATNLGDLYCAEVVVCKQTVDGLKAQGAGAGVPLVYSAAISLTGTDFTAQCLAAKQAGVQALSVGSSPEGTARVAADCERQGFRPVYVVLGVQWSTSMATLPGLKDNTWSPYANLPFFADNPAITALNTAMDKYYPGVRTAATTPSEILVGMWAAGILVEDATKASGTAKGTTLTAAQLKKGLESLNGDTLQGLAPPLTYAPGKDHPVDCWFIGHFTNGKGSVVGDGKPSCLNT
ncbi:ABC transporter substrate-binding protein [Pseudofrankia sp. DC12]|uniref:ABC transporter substrate-binding protein n=1 Tax=Pseudofrankia sp. DC12 TaxID=683315 RepID=UPI0018DD6A84|nr:ABC transporter substrate-binding protein [Pseudofrankia sp. DC12]